MIDAYSQGYDIVYGVRCNRDSDTFLNVQQLMHFTQ